MHPSFGVPWPRLQRAAARFNELHPSPRDTGRVHALLFVCGLTYHLTYRDATRRRLTHYLDDGLREAIEHTLPALMHRCARLKTPPTGSVRGIHLGRTFFEQLVRGFEELGRRLPGSTAHWLNAPGRDANLLRLIFGMGVASRFHPASHSFVRELLAQPGRLPRPVLDVVESFHWHPDWSLALAR